MKRRILCWLLALVTVCSVAALTACEQKPEITVTLTETLSVSVFKTVTLTATTNSEEAVVYTSSDESVLSIDANGLITPKKVGTATVRATVEEKYAECAVTVTAPAADELSVAALTRTVNLKTTKTATVEAQAYVGDELLDGATFTFESSNENVASVSENGTVTGVNKGEATITITGTCKGVALGSDTVTVTVTEDVTIETNVTELNLYTRAASAETPTESALTVTVKINDEAVADAQYQVQSSDENVVAYQDGKLVAKGKKGMATVTVSYTSALGTAASATIDVTTVFPTEDKTIETPYVVGLNRGTSVEIEPDFSVEAVLGAIIGEEEYPAKLEAGKIVVELNGVKAGADDHMIVVSADSADTTYRVTLKATVYDYLIGDKTEFAAFLNALNGTDYIYAKLTANVDMENKAVQTANNPSDCSGDEIVTAFLLDGSGYTVSNMSGAGLRGVIAAKVGRNSVIKNIALNNVAAVSAHAGGLFMTVTNVKFENFYLSTAVNYNWGSPIALWSEEGVSYQNVVVCCYSVADENRTQTGFGRTMGALTSESLEYSLEEKNYTDTYAINAWAQKMVRGPWHTEGEDNDVVVEDNATKYTEGLYKTWEDFAKDVSTLPSSFDSSIWKINEDGQLIFKTVPEAPKPVFTSRPLIEGADNENIFVPVNSANSVKWSEEENAYHLINTVTSEDDERGFYLNFDFIKALRKRGATKLSFLVKNISSGSTYVSYTYSEKGKGWWDNRGSWNHNLSDWTTFEMVFANVDTKYSVFFLSDQLGGIKVKDFKVEYPLEAAQTLDMDTTNFSLTNLGIGGAGTNHVNSTFVTDGVPEGATGSCLKMPASIYWGLRSYSIRR